MALADIDTIVILIMENRSFDHMFGYLSLPGANPSMPVEGLRDDPAWLAAYANISAGKAYPCNPLTVAVQAIPDPPHESGTIASQINTPPQVGAPTLMGGFAETFAALQPPDVSRVMGYYDAAGVPIYDFLARNFALCDHWFAALPAGTQPNRFMAMSGQSPLVDNAAVLLPSQDLVYDWLKEHGVVWCAYQSGDFFPFFSLMDDWLPEIVTSLALSDLGGRGRFRRYSKFRQHWMAADSMPSVIFIEPEYTDGPNVDPNDDHPTTGIANGQLFVADLYATLISNQARWNKTMLIITYDEHGGFFDHVPPLDIATNVKGHVFPTTGVRVPGLVISPNAKRGVFSGNLDHTSILQLLADKYNPGRDYSAAVGARQPKLARLADVLATDGVIIPSPPIPPGALGAAQAGGGPPPPPPPAGQPSVSASANSKAFQKVAAKAMREHPDLMGGPGWPQLGPLDAAGRAPT